MTALRDVSSKFEKSQPSVQDIEKFFAAAEKTNKLPKGSS